MVLAPAPQAAGAAEPHGRQEVAVIKESLPVVRKPRLYFDCEAVAGNACPRSPPPRDIQQPRSTVPLYGGLHPLQPSLHHNAPTLLPSTRIPSTTATGALCRPRIACILCNRRRQRRETYPCPRHRSLDWQRRVVAADRSPCSLRKPLGQAPALY